MTDKKALTQGEQVLAEVGGPVDESRATLAIYGDDLDPDTVSDLLGCSPSRAHRKGDRKTVTSVPFRSGAWLLTVEARSPEGPAEAIVNLLARFPAESGFWQRIIAVYDVSICVAIHTSGWNRGFCLPAGLLSRVGQIGVPIDVDLYLYGDESDDGV